jgi:hypothetical protein
MRKLGKLEHAAKVIALCLPPVVTSLIGLAALSRKKRGGAVVAGRRSAPARPAEDESAPHEAFPR